MFVMKKFSGFLVAMACLVMVMALPAAGRAQQASLSVKITQIASAKGKIMVALFLQSQGFPSDHQKAHKLYQVPAKPGELSISFAHLPAGDYAIAIYHDENGDGKLNTNALGIPKEGYGFSNNVRPKFSAPKFESAAFKVAGATQTQINLRY